MNGKTIATWVLLLVLIAGTVGASFWFDHHPQAGEPQPPAQEESGEDSSEEGRPSERNRLPEEGLEQQRQEEEAAAQEAALAAQKEAFAQEKEQFYLMLVNPDHSLPDGYTPVTGQVQNGYELDERVVPLMEQMIADAAADGVDLLVCSAYRSQQKQQSLFDAQLNQWLAAGKTQEEAYAETARAIAIPGTSEHQSGLAADIVTPSHQTLDEAFADTTAGQWLMENAWKYGFILRFPKDKEPVTKIMYESWHYRYVGVLHAKLIHDSGLCLEEYLDQELPENWPATDEERDQLLEGASPLALEAQFGEAAQPAAQTVDETGEDSPSVQASAADSEDAAQ